MTPCMHFRNHLATGLSTPLSKELQEHLAECSQCQTLYEADQILEHRIQKSFEAVILPEGLDAGIRLNIAQASAEKKGRRCMITWFTPALAAAIVFFLLLVPMPGKLSSVEEVSALVVEDHLKKQKMMFTCDNTKSAAWWFESRIDFMTRIPDLRSRGYRFVGGRTCTLKGKKVAALLYEKNGERVSLYILDKRDTNFDVNGRLIYDRVVGTCQVEIWEDDERLYALAK